MNKKDLENIKTEYQNNFTYYVLTGYNRESQEYERIKGIELFLKGIEINFTPWKNEIILDKKESLITEWKEFCQFANKEELTCNKHNTEYLIEEIQFISENEKQYNARITRIEWFIERINKFNINIPN